MKFGNQLKYIREKKRITKYRIRKETQLQYSQIDAIENDGNYDKNSFVTYLKYLKIEIKFIF